MREIGTPSVIVIDKPHCGFVSTKSSISQIVDADYFGIASPARALQDSDCGGCPDNRVQALTVSPALADCQRFLYRHAFTWALSVGLPISRSRMFAQWRIATYPSPDFDDIGHSQVFREFVEYSKANRTA